MISSFFPSSTPHIDAKASTSLASALNSVETKWRDTPAYTSAGEAIYSAAPTKLQPSIATSGYIYEQVTTETWYTKNVPKAVQTAIDGHVSSIISVEQKVLGTGTSTSKAGAAQQTGMAVAGVVGVVGVLANL